MSDSEGSADGLYQRMITNPMFRSFLLFSLFRAVYGAGILVVTWFLASETEAPLWTSILFLLCSMVFSRVLFRFLKKAGKGQENDDVDQMLG